MAIQSPPGGSIIAISSISALVGGGEQTHYTPTKAGIKSGSPSLSLPLSPRRPPHPPSLGGTGLAAGFDGTPSTETSPAPL